MMEHSSDAGRQVSQPHMSDMPHASQHGDGGHSGAGLHDHAHEGHSHQGRSCGSANVAHLQAAYLADFRRYLQTLPQHLLHARRHLATNYSSTSTSGSGSSGSTSDPTPATLRIKTDWQLDRSLPEAHREAAMRAVRTAVRVIQKFVQVGCCCVEGPA